MNLDAYTHHLRTQLEDACVELAFERPGPALCAAVERAASQVMHGERQAGRCLGFAVRCTMEGEHPALEVSFQPPRPRARAVRLNLALRP